MVFNPKTVGESKQRKRLIKKHLNGKWISIIDLSSHFAEKGNAKIIRLAFRGPAQISPGAWLGSISPTHALAASLCCFPFT